MKKIIIVLVVVAAAIGLYTWLKPDSSVEKAPPGQNTPVDTARPDPSNATFTFDGVAVSLRDGKHTAEIGPGGAFTEETSLLDPIAYGDINDDGKNDAVVVAGRYGGGSGLFMYVAAYTSGSTSYRGSNAVFLGDRVIPQELSISPDGVITVEYLDRGPDEPFAAEPTVPSSKQFVYKSGELRER